MDSVFVVDSQPRLILLPQNNLFIEVINTHAGSRFRNITESENHQLDPVL
jgi:hypothetical protein